MICGGVRTPEPPPGREVTHFSPNCKQCDFSWGCPCQSGPVNHSNSASESPPRVSRFTRWETPARRGPTMTGSARRAKLRSLSRYARPLRHWRPDCVMMSLKYATITTSPFSNALCNEPHRRHRLTAPQTQKTLVKAYVAALGHQKSALSPSSRQYGLSARSPASLREMVTEDPTRGSPATRRYRPPPNVIRDRGRPVLPRRRAENRCPRW